MSTPEERPQDRTVEGETRRSGIFPVRGGWQVFSSKGKPMSKHPLAYHEALAQLDAVQARMHGLRRRKAAKRSSRGG